MITFDKKTLDLSRYPELNAFINSTEEKQQEKCLDSMRDYYQIPDNPRIIWTIEICAAYGKASQLHLFLTRFLVPHSALVSALIAAIEYDQESVVAKMLEFPALITHAANWKDQIIPIVIERKQIAILKLLLTKKIVVDLIAKEEDNHTLCSAIYKKNIELVACLLAIPALQETVATPSNLPLTRAIEGKQLEIINLLLSFDAVKKGISSRMLELAYDYGLSEIAYQMLHIPSVLKMIEAKPIPRLTPLLLKFFNAHLKALEEKIVAFEEAKSQGHFDISPDELPIYFILLKFIIRRNHRELDTTMHLLLGLPSIASKAHTLGAFDHYSTTRAVPTFRGMSAESMGPADMPRGVGIEPKGQQPLGNSNKLLHLALTVNNIPAARALFRLPSVFDCAKANQFYRNDQSILKERIRNSLQCEPEKIINPLLMRALEERYAQQVSKLGGIKAVFESFITWLTQAYDKHPARLPVFSNYELPRDWSSFNEQIPDQFRQIALTAYFTHPVHTAYRFLSKSNYWLAPDALFAFHSKDDYEPFEDFVPLIAYLWLAVKDPALSADMKEPPERRVKQFIHTIAKIGRGLNWDPTLESCPDDTVLLGFDGDKDIKDYDNRKPDNPMSYSQTYLELLRFMESIPAFSELIKNLKKIPTLSIEKPSGTFFSSAASAAAGAPNPFQVPVTYLESEDYEQKCSVM